MVDALTAVERALRVFSTVPPNDWSALRDGLSGAGVPGPMAGDVAAFMPIAFGRELLNGSGMEFSPDYATHAGGATKIAGKLAEHPVYAAAAALATRMVERREGGDAFVAVAVWSSEFLAANEALNAGSQLADLVAGPPVIIGDDDAPAPAAAEAKRPWWKVWG
jgi:hypothetical protein